ncbi:hypothetical protein JCM8097_008739 [Rhodosporidiobolus ruineniae]
MDNAHPGFHSRRREERLQRNAARKAQQGLSAGIETTQPLNAEVAGPKATTGVYPPTEPIPAHEGSHRRMQPHLQLMTNVMLRYDTIVDRVWHGFAMIVTTDTGSDYSSPPTMTLEWDATGGELAQKLEQGLVDVLLDDDSVVHRRRIEGQRIFTYHSLAGGQSFWRFKLEMPLSEREEEISYSVNGGLEDSFYVPAANQDMRVMYYSCNGFSASVDQVPFNGPYPLWRDVLVKHEEKPIHVMVGGGDQLYVDAVTREPEIAPWIAEQDLKKKLKAPCTPEMQAGLDRFFFNWYCAWFRGGAFGIANGKIPMLNMLDDHDLIDGFGSYPEALQTSPVFSSIGAAAYKWYLLFQQFMVDDVDGLEPSSAADSPSRPHPFKSLILGGPGTYIPSANHSFLSSLGPKQAILLVDWRAERKQNQLASETTYKRIDKAVMGLPAGVQHLVVQLGVPIAYPRLTILDKLLAPRFNPMVLLAWAGIAPGAINKFNAEAELKDDLADHPCSAHHLEERNGFILRMQELAVRKHLRVSFMSGDVHSASSSKFYSVPPLSPAQDPRFMLQIVSSAVVNSPPGSSHVWLVTKLGQKKHQDLIHAGTEEELIPLFQQDTDGSEPKSQTIMARRNYTITEYDKATDELDFRIQVEVSKGSGTTKEYSIRAPAPRW